MHTAIFTVKTLGWSAVVNYRVGVGGGRREMGDGRWEMGEAHAIRVFGPPVRRQATGSSHMWAKQRFFLPFIQHLPSAVYHPPSAVYHPPSAIYHPPSAIYHLPSLT